MATLSKHDTQTNRTVVLDFNGGLQVYRNPELGMKIPVRIEPSGISADRARMLAEALNRDCADSHVRFELGAGSTESKSSVRIGRTSDFDRYGAFLGLAEGIGEGDAYVLLDDSASDAELLSVIRHEAGHILGTLDHGGAGLARYAWEGKDYNYISAYLADKYPDQYKVYLRTITTTEFIYTPVVAPTGLDTLIVSYVENGTTIKYVYDSASINRDVSTERISNTDNQEYYRTASGIWARDIQVYGGSVKHCTAGTMTVSGRYDYDRLDGYEGNLGGEYVSVRFNYKYHQGVAIGCTVKEGLLDPTAGLSGMLIVEGNGVAKQCTAESITVKGRLERSYYESRSDTTIEEYQLFNGLAENCTVNGGWLRVEFGGIANDIIIRSEYASLYDTRGDAIIGCEGDIAAWREEVARAEEEGEYSYSEQKIAIAEDGFAQYGSARANNLIVEKGNVQVNYGGELHNATIDGTLYASEGASLSGVITC